MRFSAEPARPREFHFKDINIEQAATRIDRTNPVFDGKCFSILRFRSAEGRFISTNNDPPDNQKCSHTKKKEKITKEYLFNCPLKGIFATPRTRTGIPSCTATGSIGVES